MNKPESSFSWLKSSGAFTALMTAGLILAGLALAAADQKPNLPVTGEGRLGGPDRPLLFLATDKPIYRPGETVYARLVALKADNFFPLRETGRVQLRIQGPRQNRVATIAAQLTDSTAGFSWTIPEGTPGGRYQAEATYQGSPVAMRPFEIRAYQPPRLRSQIEFLREGYGPGQEVSAVVKVTRAEGGIPAGAKLTVVARVDGQEAARLEGLSLDSEGLGRAVFTLPKEIEKGEGSLAFVIEDGGTVETASKTIPILFNNMEISFFPESGELVGGLPARIYFQARRPDGKPADVRGQVIRLDEKGVAQSGKPLTELATSHEGRGWTEFTPEADQAYAVRLIEPAGLEDKLFPLPPVRSNGAVIRPQRPVFAFDDPIKINVRASADSGAAWLTLYHREKQLDLAEIKAGTNEVVLAPGETEGVMMVTAWDRAGKPLAERLIFRQPKFTVKIKLSPEPAKEGGAPVPGGKMRLKVETTDENDRPVEAVVGLAVTDDSLLEMVETRDQAPSLPVMVLLENEVTDLADAAVYFDPQNPDAARDIDLLLGVQGWRRFILTRLEAALKENPDAVRRAMAIKARPPQGIPADAVRRQRLNAEKFENAMPMAVQMAPDAAPLAAQPEPEVEAPLLQADLAGDVDFLAHGQDLALAGPPPVIAARHDEVGQAAMMREVQIISIREYAHKARADRKPNDRRDFTETIYWHAGLRTNPRDGSAMVEFDLPDSVTTFKVRADAFGNNGALGQGAAEIASLEPFYAEAKLPPALVAGDRPLIPVTVVNSTAETLAGVNLIAQGEELKPSQAKAPAKLAPAARERVLISLAPDKAGQYELNLKAAAGAYADSVTRKLEIRPRGFPISQTASGLVGPDKPFETTVAIADDAAPGSLIGTIKVYPTPLANMEEALNALLRQPHGCFEQTSSTSYPLVMAQRYFMSHQGVDPDKIKKADALLKDGYNKLISFESPKKGYEWFGGDPGHEALTAYGLMQFMEMKEVRPVDSAMLERTRAWLMSRRDGQGGFKRNERALDSFGGAPAPLTNLYILWSLLESGEKPEGLKAEIEAARKVASETKDPYLKSLGVNIFHLAGDQALAHSLAADLRRAVTQDGSLGGAQTSITRSAGESLTIETTSLAILGWLRVGDDFAGDVEKSMAWLFERCKAGRFGSTQSTILALKAINAYDTARSKPKAPGTLQLVIDGQNFGSPLTFDQNSQGALELPDFAAKLSPGKHSLKLVMTGGGDMPFALETGYHSNRPADSPDCPLELSTALSAKKIKEGELADLKVSLTVKGNNEVPMPLVIVGLPAGLEPRHERLKEMKSAGELDAYEVLGRELVIYWRNMKPGDQKELSLPLTAEIPGTFTAPASRAYGYYLEEHKNWAAGETVEISPR